MQANDSQPNPLPSETTPTTQTQETTPIGSNPVIGNQPEKPEPAKPAKKSDSKPVAEEVEQVVPVSQLPGIIAEAIRQAFAQQAEAEKIPAFPLPVVETTATSEAADAPKGKGLFGNADKKKEYNLAKLLPNVEQLPDDKYILVAQKHNVNQDKSTVEDVSARSAKVVDIAMYEQATTGDKATGEKPYDVLFGSPGTGGGYVVVHKPTK